MNPNDTQVAGTHYRAGFQHWDLVAKLRLDYFQGQITKYVTRHRRKHGAQDLDKAIHFLMKVSYLHAHGDWPLLHLHPTSAMLHDYQAANQLNLLESRVVFYVCTWTTQDGMKLAEQALYELHHAHYPRDLPAPVKRSDEDRLALIDGDMFRGVSADDRQRAATGNAAAMLRVADATEYRTLKTGIDPVSISMVKSPDPGCEAKTVFGAGGPATLTPCRSPYCECPVGRCSHPGCYDARGTTPGDDGGPGPGYVDQGRDA